MTRGIGARARRDGRGRAARARREFRDGSRGEARREWTGRGRGPKGARARRGRGASFGTGRAATARREARDGSRGEGPARVDGTGSEAEGRGARGEGAVRGALGRPPGGRMSGCSAWVRVTHHSRAGAGVASSVGPLKAAARGGGGRLPDGPVRTGRGTCLEGPIEWSRRREAPMMRQRPDLCVGGRRREARPPFRQRGFSTLIERRSNRTDVHGRTIWTLTSSSAMWLRARGPTGCRAQRPRPGRRPKRLHHF